MNLPNNLKFSNCPNPDPALDQNDLIEDQTIEFKELSQQIHYYRNNDTSDTTTINNETLPIVNHNLFQDDFWTQSTNKKPLTKSVELLQSPSKLFKPGKSHSTNSLRIPSGNYTFIPKKMAVPETSSHLRKNVTILDLPSDDSEDEARNQDYEYSNCAHNNYPNQYPFNQSSSINSNFFQSFSSTNDTIHNVSQSNINFPNTIERKMQHISPTYQHRLNNNIQFNHFIRPSSYNMSQTPNPSSSSFSFGNLCGSYPSPEINNAFSMKNSNNYPCMIQRKPTQEQPQINVNLADEQNKNVINVNNIIMGSERRTTVMIKHIPVKYTTKSLIAEIEVNFKNKFDIFYLPMDFKNKGNLGYAFINFIDPLHIIHFMHCFKGEKWKEFNSQKECDLSYARFQGKDELIVHLEKSSQKTKEEKKAVLFKIKKPFPRFILPNIYYDLIINSRPKLINSIDFL